MSSHRDKKYGMYSFECDVCGDTEESDAPEFMEAWAEVRDEKDWKYRDGKHICATCVEEIGL